MPCDCADKSPVQEERPQAASPNGKLPLRGRTARQRRAIDDLAFMIHEGLRADGLAPNTRAKLLAWAGMYGVTPSNGK